jgi:hypothetical protein
MSLMGRTKEEWLAYLEGHRRYNEWEKRNPNRMAPEQALLAISNLYDFLPEASRHRNDDPEGMRCMMSCLAALS